MTFFAIDIYIFHFFTISRDERCEQRDILSDFFIDFLLIFKAFNVHLLIPFLLMFLLYEIILFEWNKMINHLAYKDIQQIR
jgi:hypothetical protein